MLKLAGVLNNYVDVYIVHLIAVVINNSITMHRGNNFKITLK
jgi:hypothetical protein